MLDKPSASDAKAALVPVVWTDCRASVCRPRKGAYALFALHSSNGRDDLCFLCNKCTHGCVVCAPICLAYALALQIKLWTQNNTSTSATRG